MPCPAHRPNDEDLTSVFCTGIRASATRPCGDTGDAIAELTRGAVYSLYGITP
ncbi:hypothetical protein [Saccharopolyspora pogona]|uniref:hypothetical protein n=1 Tax=Saccharopolyspora pogona TaxID=333966 RepID=UPI0016883AB3|nr:hypothetical protein [Saccharopolyspora pogona]